MTTVAISQPTKRRLDQLKEEWRLGSLDAVVLRLLDERRTVPASMYGIDKGIGRLTRKRRDEIWS